MLQWLTDHAGLLINVAVGAALVAMSWGWIKSKLPAVKLPSLGGGGSLTATTIDPHDVVEQRMFAAIQEIGHGLAQNGMEQARRKALLDPLLTAIIDYREPGPPSAGGGK